MKMNETIRSRRKELNLTQEQVADYLGVTAPAVHKWEKGISYPDVSLLPALARLLRMDLNTLFSFEKEMTEQEIRMFSNELVEIMQREGFEAGYEKAIEKIREFPNCASLFCSLAALLDGSLVLFLVKDTAKYESMIEALYERAVELGDASIREQAKQMLILKYMKRKDFDKAEKLLDTLPDAPVDKNSLKATLLINKEQIPEAIRIFEGKLWFNVNGVQSTLTALMNCFQKRGEEENAELCARKTEEITHSFGLWEYGRYAADYEMAVYRKDREKSLYFLRLMLKSLQSPFGCSDFPLFAEIMQKESSVQSLMASAIIESIKKEEGLDGKGFLRGDAELEEILRDFEGGEGRA